MSNQENHTCNQKSSFEALMTMISSNKGDINANSRSVKKLYTWQATVGISLLVFFLTVGAAALRYVDKLDFAVEVNKTDINRIEASIKEDKKFSREDLNRVLQDFIKRSNTN